MENNARHAKTTNNRVSSKVAAGGIAVAVMTIIVWLVHEFAGVTVPAEVAGAAATVISFGAGWLVREKRG